MMLAVDLSFSMQEEDFELQGQWVDRLSATKAVAQEFIMRRKGDRIGLILFGENAYLQTPLTFDRETVRTLLLESQIGLAGRATAIGDAIGLALKRLRDQDDSNRVLILLTDGANTAGEIEPIQAAELAAQNGLTIYTIGIGADEMLVRSLFGTRRVNPSADLDESTLRGIAQMTGGQYFRARDTGELEKIYQLLDALEPIEQDPETFRPVAALFQWPLGAALILAGALALFQIRDRTI
jgi:Ca-activated chloride channel family protein